MKQNFLEKFREKTLFVLSWVIIALFIVLLPLTWGKNEIKDIEETWTEKPFVACFWCTHYDSDTNSCIDGDEWSKRCEAWFPTDTLEERWYPWKLADDWLSQVMPEIENHWSHERFKELAKDYRLDPWKIWEVENKYNIREWVVLCLVIAETSWGKNGYWVEGCWNYGNVGNNDRGDRYCFESAEVGLSKIGKTLNNDFLWTTQTLGCLSKAGSCTWWEDKGYIYASSDWNWERTMLNCLNTIYEEELGTIDPVRFNVRRVFTIYQ
jgi:hypothetical protein